jgi:hypothetical protein
MAFKLSMLWLIAGFALAVCGCAGSSRPQRDVAATQPTINAQGHEVWSSRRQQEWNQHPLRGRQAAAMVAQGPTPLVYIDDLGGPLRVVDLTTNVAIATAVAPPKSLVRVDDVHGVIIGSETIVPGPLPGGHRYAIALDPETDNTFRQSAGPQGIEVPR